MKRGKDHCLTNVPNPSKMVGGPLCGNEIVEFGEECDCGYPQFCERSVALLFKICYFSMKMLRFVQ